MRIISILFTAWPNTCLYLPFVDQAALTQLCRQELSLGKYRIICRPCIEDCVEREWPYSLLRKVAPESAIDLQRFDFLVTENYFRSTSCFRKCPGCAIWSYCDRRQVALSSRVTCPMCAKVNTAPFHYCWYCHTEWPSDQTGRCDNANCEPISYMINRPRKNIDRVEGCPSMRACPLCGFLQEHLDACKSMKCMSCENSSSNRRSSNAICR